MAVIFGERIRTELYGTSHGPCIGVRADGVPPGWLIDLNELQEFLSRRAPGRNAWSTPRKEADRPEFISGVKSSDNDVILETTGETLIAEIRNTNTRPQDYRESAVVPRPGHADWPAFVKYGKIESGGGQFSARLTAALCIIGGICLQQLERLGIEVKAHIYSIGEIGDRAFDPMGDDRIVGTDFPVIDPAAGEDMKELIAAVKEEGDSIGGAIECMISGMPPGKGEPLFGSIESRICQTVFAVPAVKGIDFGTGFDVAYLLGSENNDPYILRDGQVRTETNGHGGILGGLSSGMPIIFRTAMKPTPSIAMPQRSVNLTTMTETELAVRGRHDPCIVPRAVPCIEAAAALAIGDILLAEELL